MPIYNYFGTAKARHQKFLNWHCQFGTLKRPGCANFGTAGHILALALALALPKPRPPGLFGTIESNTSEFKLWRVFLLKVYLRMK